MGSARRYLLIALSFAVAMAAFTVLAPRTVHALAAALVQVSNPPSNPAMVRSVDEPARAPYFSSGRPTCQFLNQCVLTGTEVPAGMRLRITHINGVITGNFSGFAGLTVDNTNALAIMVPLTPADGAFFGGTSMVFNQPVDFYIDEGHTPLLQVGTASTISNALFQSMTISGYLVNKQP